MLCLWTNRPGWGEKAVLGPGPWKNQIRSYFCHRRLPLEAQIESKANRGKSERASETLLGLEEQLCWKQEQVFVRELSVDPNFWRLVLKMTHPHLYSNDLLQDWLLDYVSRNNGSETHHSLSDIQTIPPALSSLLTEPWALQAGLLPNPRGESWLVKANHDHSIPLAYDWFRKKQLIQFWPMRYEGKYTSFLSSSL